MKYDFNNIFKDLFSSNIITNLEFVENSNHKISKEELFYTINLEIKDTALGSTNLGDEIIYGSIKNALRELLYDSLYFFIGKELTEMKIWYIVLNVKNV